MLCNSKTKLYTQKSNLKLGKKNSIGFMKKSKGMSSLLHVTHPNMKDNFNTYVHHHGYNICTSKIKINVWYTYTYITSYNKWFVYIQPCTICIFFVCLFLNVGTCTIFCMKIWTCQNFVHQCLSHSMLRLSQTLLKCFSTQFPI